MRCPTLSEFPPPSPGKTGWPWTEESPQLPGTMPDGSPWPRVSIVTPSYNQGQFIEETIRSVLLQGYSNLEYIVIDGGSTDGSVEIIRRYAERLAYWVSEPDRGQSDAINKGFFRASGKILAWLNSDDLYLPGAITRAVEYLEEHPRAGIVYGAYKVIEGDGCAVEDCSVPPEYSFATLLRYHFPQPTMFFRREVIERVGPLQVDLQYSMDWDLMLRAAMNGVNIERIPGPPLAAIRVWEGAKTTNRFERGLEEDLRVLDQLLLQQPRGDAVALNLALAKAHACLWPAYEYYRRGEMRSARRLLSRARALHGGIVTRWDFVGLYARTLLGQRSSRIMRSGKQFLARGLRRVRG